MPDGSMQMESYDGILRIVNVSREMTGTYKCQTSQYNGFNVKPREALVQLIVQCEFALPLAFLCGNEKVASLGKGRQLGIAAVGCKLCGASDGV